jgi:hypothetical protein
MLHPVRPTMDDVSQTIERRELVFKGKKAERQRAVPCTAQPPVDEGLHKKRFGSHTGGNEIEENFQSRPENGSGKGDVSPRAKRRREQSPQSFCIQRWTMVQKLLVESNAERFPL